MQLFVRLPGAPTVAVELVDERANIAALQQALEERTGIPAAEQLLTAGGRPLRSGAPHAALAHGATLDLLLRLAGGKGGFGALLRGQGRDGKITDNFDACRDLQGRRLKTVEAEKKLREWAAQAKERELEKLAAKHIRDLARQQRQERDYEVNVEAVRNEQRAALERVHEAVESALAEGLAGPSKAAGGGASGSGGSGSGPSSSSDTAAAAAAGEGDGCRAAGEKRKAADAAGSSGEEGGSDGKDKGKAAAPSPVKRQRRGGMLDMLEGSDDEDDSSSSDDE